MVTIAKIQRLDKLNKKGEAPIYFRIIKNRQIRYIASGIRIEEKFWNQEKERVKTNHVNYKRLNSYLSKKFLELQDKVYALETTSIGFTTSMLKKHVLGKEPENFIAYAKKDLEKLWREGKVATHGKHKSIINKLEEFMDGRNLFFQNMDVAFLKKYEKYLREHHGNKTNTVLKDLKFFRKLFNDAIREDLIEPSSTPFLKYKLKTEKTQRAYLTEPELAKIEGYKATPFTRMDMHRDMFVFSAYVGGLRVSDVIVLEHDSFKGDHVHSKIRKTNGQLSIRLPKKAKAIIEKWKKAPNASKRFLFPILPDDVKLNDTAVESIQIVDKAISSATAYINKNLKSIGQKVGLKKNISTHIARHTWATRALRKGITIDKVSKLMGHAQIRETQIYAKIANDDLDKAMILFDD